MPAPLLRLQRRNVSPPTAHRPPATAPPPTPHRPPPTTQLRSTLRNLRIHDPELLQIRVVLRGIVIELSHLVAILRHLLGVEPNRRLVRRRDERAVLDRLRLHVHEVIL